jgi:hypothetical protein
MAFSGLLCEVPFQCRPIARAACCSREQSTLPTQAEPKLFFLLYRSTWKHFPISYRLCLVSFSYALICIIYACMSNAKFWRHINPCSHALCPFCLATVDQSAYRLKKGFVITRYTFPESLIVIIFQFRKTLFRYIQL